MSSSLLPRSLVLSTFSALLLLTALPARADLPIETIYLSRAEISDESLRGVIGIAVIQSMRGEDQQPGGELPRFLPDGESFKQDGAVVLKELVAISGSDYDVSVRKLPVVERRGHYVHVVINARTNERAWLSEIQEDGEGPELHFLSFDSKEWEWSGVELYHFAPKGESRLYLAPKSDARSYRLSPDYPPRINGEYADQRIIKARGNFLQLGAWVSMDEPLAPLGWVPISDENGLLLIWPVYAPMC
ncbi:hypothetical protein [Hyalangium gracile]|uniref:hypothetical protein n=1 Tax=Hyalangium gracile TaxID=394092 RepID=UPI001CCDCD65|nr:hypothetical protein [Hyalangium gracile]